MGLVRNAAPVAPLGVFLSLRLQHDLNDAIQAVWQSDSFLPPPWWRRWYRRKGLTLNPQTIQDLQMLQATLDENIDHPAWTRDIGLLVIREPTHICLSDASYGGLGAWSAHYHFDFMWRLTREDLYVRVST